MVVQGGLPRRESGPARRTQVAGRSCKGLRRDGEPCRASPSWTVTSVRRTTRPTLTSRQRRAGGAANDGNVRLRRRLRPWWSHQRLILTCDLIRIADVDRELGTVAQGTSLDVRGNNLALRLWPALGLSSGTHISSQRSGDNRPAEDGGDEDERHESGDPKPGQVNLKSRIRFRRKQTLATIDQADAADAEFQGTIIRVAGNPDDVRHHLLR
jgi:hypothetical protein